MANQTNSLSHTKWVCKYHIVFVPKYRRKIIYNQYHFIRETPLMLPLETALVLRWSNGSSTLSAAKSRSKVRPALAAPLRCSYEREKSHESHELKDDLQKSTISAVVAAASSDNFQRGCVGACLRRRIQFASARLCELCGVLLYAQSGHRFLCGYVSSILPGCPAEN